MRPKVPIWSTPGSPNPQNMVFYVRKTFISAKSTNLNFEPLWSSFLLQWAPLWRPMVPKASERDPKWLPVSRHFFTKFVNFSDPGTKWAWKVATRSHSLPKWSQNAPKSDPAWLKNIKNPKSTSPKKAFANPSTTTLQPSPHQFIKSWRGRRQRR